MKITEVEAMSFELPDDRRERCDGTQDTLVVRIHTDAGLVGVGEVDSCAARVQGGDRGADRRTHLPPGCATLLIGEDPLDVERLWEKIYRGSIYFGAAVPGIHAMSGIDIALWDLCGKALGQPVHRPPRRRPPRPGARLREHAHAGDAGRGRRARRRSDGPPAGSPAIKLGWGGFGRRLDSRRRSR